MMRRLFWAAFLMGSTANAALADADPLFDFHENFVEKAGSGVQFDVPEIVCTVNAELGGEGLGVDATFLAERGMGTEVWALLDFPLTDLNSFWTGGEFNVDPRNPQTQEWGWVYDRNGDGWIDWVSHVDGSLPVLPEGGLPEGFPAYLDGLIRITSEQLAFIRANGRVVYRHILDADFDRVPDHVIVMPVSLQNGWPEGAMLISVRPGGGDCLWRSDYDANDTRACEADGAAFVTTGDKPVRRADVPLEALESFFYLITETAGKCDFGAEGIEPHP